MTMKKYLLTILLGAFGIMALVAPALAVTNVSFTPIKVNARQGQIFTLTIGVNPQGVKNYTAKVELHYPANLLEVKSFTFASGWMSLSQSGYDLTDNLNGVLIKTAGYPSGISAPTTFGTVSFRAKQNGNGIISLNSNSFVYDANSQNVLTNSSAQTMVAISAPVVAPIIPPKPLTVEVPVSPPSVETPIVPAPEQPIVALSLPSSPIATRSLSASIGNILSLGTDSAIVGFLVVVVVAYLLYAVIRNARRKKSGNEPNKLS